MYIFKLLNIYLNQITQWNVFLQIQGVAMGTKLAPNLADIFMAVMDAMILNTAAKYGEGVFPLAAFLRFLDMFCVFTGSLEKLHEFFDAINNLHPSIKFTMTHTKLDSDTGCDCEVLEKLPFLDTSL